MAVEEAMQIKNTDIAAHLKLPPVKLHCSMLAEDAIKAAINDYKSKKNLSQTKEWWLCKYVMESTLYEIGFLEASLMKSVVCQWSGTQALHPLIHLTFVIEI